MMICLHIFYKRARPEVQYGWFSFFFFLNIHVISIGCCLDKTKVDILRVGELEHTEVYSSKYKELQFTLKCGVGYISTSARASLDACEKIIFTSLLCLLFFMIFRLCCIQEYFSYTTTTAMYAMHCSNVFIVCMWWQRGSFISFTQFCSGPSSSWHLSLLLFYRLHELLE